MNQSKYEPILLKYFMSSDSLLEKVNSTWFDNVDCQIIFKNYKTYKKAFQDNPSKVQLLEYIKSNGYKDITNTKINSIYDIDISANGYSESWAEEQSKTWIRIKNLHHILANTVEYVNSTDIDSDNSEQVYNTAIQILSTGQNLSFNFEKGLDFFDIDSHTTEQTEYYSTGYDFLDDTIGGWSVGTLHVFVGPPKIGKTLTLGNVSTKSMISGNNTCIITLELSESKYIKRLSSDIMNIDISKYSEVSKTPQFKQMLLDVTANLTNKGALKVKGFPTSTLTVPQLESYLLEEEKNSGIKFKTIIIDYLNLMCNHRNPNTENTYMKIKQLSEDLRAMAQRNDWCVITATQSKRDNFGASDINMEDVAESAGLVHTVDSLIGLIQTSNMYRMCEYLWKILCNRDGGYKNAKKLFNVDYNYMRLSECENSSIIEEDSIY